MTRQTLYIAGPMTGIPHFNFPAFDAAAAELREHDYQVISPADHDRETFGDRVEGIATGDAAALAAIGFSRREALAWDLAQICRVADGIAVLDGWQESSGAMAEVHTAQALGLPVSDVLEWILEALA